MKIVIDDLDLSKFDKTFITQWLNNSKELKLEFVYKSIFSNTSIIRNCISVLCDHIWLDSIMKFKIVLIVDELNNNAIEYWSNINDINIMRINIQKRSDYLKLNIEVEDSGKWDEHKTSKEMDEIWKIKLKEWFNNHSSIRWRGLFLIIKNIVDKLYFLDSKTWWLIVWIRKKIKI